MSPLFGQPNRGYADWQRLENYDSGILYQYTGGDSNSRILSNVFDVSRYAYLGGQLGVQTNPCLATLRWYNDAAGSVRLGQRIFGLDSSGVAAMQMHLPNLGPFCQVQLDPIGGLTFTPTILTFGTNREHPLEEIPYGSVLANWQAFPINAGQVAIFPINHYYAGPVAVFFSTPNSGHVLFDFLDPGGSWYTFASTAQATNNTINTAIVAPVGAWRFRVQNDGAANGTFTLVMVHSETGST